MDCTPHPERVEAKLTDIDRRTDDLRVLIDNLRREQNAQQQILAAMRNEIDTLIAITTAWTGDQ